jgi:hypothetical protein
MGCITEERKKRREEEEEEEGSGEREQKAIDVRC